jgi:hypothetical protein
MHLRQKVGGDARTAGARSAELLQHAVRAMAEARMPPADRLDQIADV